MNPSLNRRRFLQNTAALAGGVLTTLATPLFAAGWKAGAALPDLSSFGLEGSLPKTQGKVVYLDFWASWCAPCKASFPVLNRWHTEYGPRGFMVLGVSVDDTAAAMKGFLEKNSVAFPTARDAAHKLVAAANVSTMPSSFLIDRQGVIRVVHSGFHAKDEAKLSAEITKLLA